MLFIIKKLNLYHDFVIIWFLTKVVFISLHNFTIGFQNIYKIMPPTLSKTTINEVIF
jgi:hypothetical protein